MIPAILISSSNRMQKNYSPIQKVDLDTQQKFYTSQLIMQWTLDENSKLICKWVKAQY